MELQLTPIPVVPKADRLTCVPVTVPVPAMLPPDDNVTTPVVVLAFTPAFKARSAAVDRL